MGGSLSALGEIPASIATQDDDKLGILKEFIAQYDLCQGDPVKLTAALTAKLQELRAPDEEEAPAPTPPEETPQPEEPVEEAPAPKIKAVKKDGWTHVLIVDRDDDALKQAKHVLRQAFYGEQEKLRFSTAKDKAGALEALIQANAEGAAVNVVLPEMDFEFMDLVNDNDDLATTTSISVLASQETDPAAYDESLRRGANEVVMKPLTVRKAAQVLLNNGVDAMGPSFPIQQKSGLSKHGAAILDTAWSAPLSTKDGETLTLGEFDGEKLALAFVTSLISSVVSRNFVRQLTYYAKSLDSTVPGALLIVVCTDNKDTITQICESFDIRYAIVCDPDLVISATYVGICADADGNAAPRTGLVLIDDKRLLDRQIALVDDDLDRATFLHHDHAEAAGATTAAVAGKLSGIVSAFRYLHSATEKIYGASIFDTNLWFSQPSLLKDADDVAIKLLKVKESLTNEDPATKRKRVVVVEDSKMSANLMIRKLLKLGHSILYAGDGCDALRLLKKFHSNIDIVISDVMMPRMDGVELLAKIKHHWGSLIPVVLLTGLEANTDQLDLLKGELGAQHVLNKPVNIDDLHSVISQSSRGTAKIRTTRASVDSLSSKPTRSSVDSEPSAA